MADPAWDRGEGEDGEEIVFVETVSTARRGRALLFASAMIGGIILGVGVVGAVWGDNKLLSTYDEFEYQTRLVQEINPAERDGALTHAARLDEKDMVAHIEYWRLRREYDRLCATARSMGRGGNCLEWEWNEPPPAPEGVAPRDSRTRAS